MGRFNTKCSAMKIYLIIITISSILLVCGCRKPYKLADDFKITLEKGGPASATAQWPYKKLYTDYILFKGEKHFEDTTAFMMCFCQTIDSIEVSRRSTKVNRYIQIIDYKLCDESKPNLVKKTALIFSPAGSADFATTPKKFSRLDNKEKVAREHFNTWQEINDYVREKKRGNYIYRGFYKKNGDSILIIFQRNTKPTYATVGFKGKVQKNGDLILYEIYSKGAWRKLNYAFRERNKLSGMYFSQFSGNKNAKPIDPR